MVKGVYLCKYGHRFEVSASTSLNIDSHSPCPRLDIKYQRMSSNLFPKEGYPKCGYKAKLFIVKKG